MGIRGHIIRRSSCLLLLQVLAATSSAAPLGPELLVSSDVAKGIPVVATNDRGQFAIAWTGFEEDDNNIYVRVYLPDGTPMGPAVVANTFLAGSQSWPSIAMDSEGNVIVVWAGRGVVSSSQPSDFSGRDTFVNYSEFLESQIREDEP